MASRSVWATSSRKPASRPRARSLGFEKLDSATIGVLDQRLSLVTLLANSKPFMPGISLSEMMTSKSSPASQSSSAASADSTQTTRSEEHTSELQSLMRTSYAVICLTKHNPTCHQHNNHTL